VLAASTVTKTTVAFINKTVQRRGFTVSVVWISRSPYSPPMASTARTTTAICPSQTPVRLSFVVSSKHSAGDGQRDVLTEPVAMIATVTSAATRARTNH
jgi:hypothetical protein